MIDRMGGQIGNYRLLRLLGQGAFADVYLGEHHYLKNYAALKLVRTALSDEQVESCSQWSWLPMSTWFSHDLLANAVYRLMV